MLIGFLLIISSSKSLVCMKKSSYNHYASNSISLNYSLSLSLSIYIYTYIYEGVSTHLKVDVYFPFEEFNDNFHFWETILFPTFKLYELTFTSSQQHLSKFHWFSKYSWALCSHPHTNLLSSFWKESTILSLINHLSYKVPFDNL